jgi:hypothetical protein
LKLEPYDEKTFKKNGWIVDKEKAKKLGLNFENNEKKDKKKEKYKGKPLSIKIERKKKGKLENFFRKLQENKELFKFIFAVLIVLLFFLSLFNFVHNYFLKENKEDFINSKENNYNNKADNLGLLKNTTENKTNNSKVIIIRNINNNNSLDRINDNEALKKCLDLNLDLVKLLKEKDETINLIKKKQSDCISENIKLNETINTLKNKIVDLNRTLLIIKKNNSLLINETKQLNKALESLAIKYCCVREVIDDKDYKYFLINGSKVSCIENANITKANLKPLKC